jgi:hypothetical protein
MVSERDRFPDSRPAAVGCSQTSVAAGIGQVYRAFHLVERAYSDERLETTSRNWGFIEAGSHS